MNNVADLYQVIVSDKQGPAPVVLNVLTTPNTVEYTGGVPSTSTRKESYVLYSALPDDLKARVKTAVEALIAGM